MPGIQHLELQSVRINTGRMNRIHSSLPLLQDVSIRDAMLDDDPRYTSNDSQLSKLKSFKLVNFEVFYSRDEKKMYYPLVQWIKYIGKRYNKLVDLKIKVWDDIKDEEDERSGRDLNLELMWLVIEPDMHNALVNLKELKSFSITFCHFIDQLHQVLKENGITLENMDVYINFLSMLDLEEKLDAIIKYSAESQQPCIRSLKFISSEHMPMEDEGEFSVHLIKSLGQLQHLTDLDLTFSGYCDQGYFRVGLIIDIIRKLPHIETLTCNRLVVKEQENGAQTDMVATSSLGDNTIARSRLTYLDLRIEPEFGSTPYTPRNIQSTGLNGAFNLMVSVLHYRIFACAAS